MEARNLGAIVGARNAKEMEGNLDAATLRLTIKEIAEIVFLTSLITPEEAKDGRRVYGHRILPKPTSSSALIRLVEQNLPCCAEVY